MARLVTSGFETGFSNSNAANSADPDGLGTGPGFVALSAQSVVVRSGGFAMRHNPTANLSRVQWSFTAPALGSTVFGRTYVNFANGLPAAATFVCGFGTSGTRISGGSLAPLAWVTVDSSGAVILRTAGGALSTSAAGSVSAAAWARIELSLLIGTGTVDAVDCRVNGVSIGAVTGLAITDTMTDNFAVGIADFSGDSNGTGDAYFDDVAVNDSTTANQATWPGDGKIVLLKPISDNAKGTGWTNDAAGASNFFDALDNTPAAGIADTTAGSGLHQIRNATANANSNYDANMTSYTTAGVGASDTINVLLPIVSTAAPVTTSAKLGTYGVVSNPAIANVNLGAGGTSGAFWSGTAAGGFPSGWKWSYGTTTYAPSVTKGTSPVARITQVTSSTRIAMVDAMGVYVDYTPGATTTPPHPTVLLQAVNRASGW